MKKEEKQNTTTITITLRKLAWKSIIDFSSKYQGMTIQQIYDQHHTATLRWYYYNYDKISFIPEILRAIGIEEEDEIKKPGKDPEKGKEVDKRKNYNAKKYCAKVFENDDKKAIADIVSKSKRRKRAANAKRVRAEWSDNTKYSKSSMAWKNQGH